MAIDKLNMYNDVRELGALWAKGKHDQVARHLASLKKPHVLVLPPLVHRYIVKEQGFAAGSELIKKLIELVE